MVSHVVYCGGQRAATERGCKACSMIEGRADCTETPYKITTMALSTGERKEGRTV